MAMSLAATIFLFASPSFSFNSNIAIDVKAFSQFVPKTEYSEDFDIVEMLGTDSIHVGIKFSLRPGQMSEIMNGDRDAINERIINDNVDDMTKILHEPVDLITDFSVRSIIRSIVREQITQQIEKALDSYSQKTGQPKTTTAEEIMEDVGIDNEYFTNFAFALYDAADAEDATVDSVTTVLYEQIDDALFRAETAGGIDTSSYDADAKASIKTTLVSTLNQLKLVEEGGHVKRISQISYMYLSDYLKKELQNKGVSEDLEQKPEEKEGDYADRLLKVFVFTQMPDVFYKGVGYVSLGLFIGMFVFAGIWGILLLWTLFKTFTRKPWTMFGFWFWILGLFQLVLGLGLTVGGKFILPKYVDISKFGLPISSILIAPRTYALIPSIIYLACIVVAIVYLFFKVPAKQEYKMEMARGGKH